MLEYSTDRREIVVTLSGVFLKTLPHEVADLTGIVDGKALQSGSLP